MKSFEEAGYWWLPNSSEHRVVGLLSYAPSDGFLLSIPLGRLDSSADSGFEQGQGGPLPLVYGTLRSGKRVTLQNIYLRKYSLAFGGETEEFHAATGFLGQSHVGHDPEIRAVSTSYTHLRDWVGSHTSQYQTSPADSAHGFSINYTYELPPPETICENQQAKVLLVHTVQAALGTTTVFRVTPDCELKMELAQPMTLEKIRVSLLEPFQQFLEFCMDRRISEPALAVQAVGSEGWLEVGVLQRTVADTDKSIAYPYILLPKVALGDRLSEVLQSWLATTGDLRRAMTLTVDLLGDEGLHDAIRFLLAAQALETFARVGAQETECSEEEYHRRVQSVIDSTDPELKTWIRRKLLHGNRRDTTSLERDLLGFIGAYVETIVPRTDDLLADIRENRNFYTHHDPRNKTRIYEGERLYLLTQAILLLLRAAVLRHLGFGPDEIEDIILSCNRTDEWTARVAETYGVR